MPDQRGTCTPSMPRRTGVGATGVRVRGRPNHVSLEGGDREGPAQAPGPTADLDRVSQGWAFSGARGRLPRPSAPAAAYDAQAALEHILARLRASAGATRV